VGGIDNNFVRDFAFTTSHDASRGGDSNVVGECHVIRDDVHVQGARNGAYGVDQPDDLEWLATFELEPS
jgi:hypothetical protein